MSTLYFAACAISCFGPIVAIYKGTQVCEQPGTRWLMAVSALAYLLTQLVKTLLMVSLIPESCSSYILCEAITQAFLRCIDFAGLCFTVHHKTALSFESNTRLLTVGLGWSLAHAVFTNLLPLLANLRGASGFQWRYLYGALAGSLSIILMRCLEALLSASASQVYIAVTSVDLVFSRVSWTALAALAFLMTRRRKQQPLLIIAADAFGSAGILCAVLLFFPFVCGRVVVGQSPSTGPGDSLSWWVCLCIQTGVNIAAAVFTLHCYYAKVSSTSAHNSSASAAGGSRSYAQVQSDRLTNGSRAKGPDNILHD